VLLNEPLILEASRVFAEKLLLEESDNEKKIVKAFQAIVCRNPKQEELDLLMKYYSTEEKAFSSNTEKAEKFVKAGEYPRAEIKNIVSLAALMQVIQTIYNLDEAITKT
jgi:hypothetical protein